MSEAPKEQLTVKGLKKSFRGRCVVNEICLDVRPGEVVGLLGPNGAGKTTTFQMVMGLLRSDGGEIRLGEEEITSWPMFRRSRAGLGYLSQEPSVFRQLAVRENLRLYLEAIGVRGKEASQRVEKYIADFDLGKVASSLAMTLSGGERRRLEIARAMVQNPKILLLDEPFSGVDPLAVEDIRNQIRTLSRSGIGLLMTDHNVRETLSSCDRAYIVKDGRIIEEGTPEEIARSEKARVMYLGERFRLEQEASP